MTFSPTYQELAHRPPKEALISLLVEGADHDEKILLPNSTVTLYGTEKLDWRGESFVVTGRGLTAQYRKGSYRKGG